MTSEGGLTHSNPDVINLDFKDSINEEGSIARRGLESAKKILQQKKNIVDGKNLPYKVKQTRMGKKYDKCNFLI